MSVNALELAPGLVIVLLLTLVVRLLSLRLLTSAQRGTRQRAEAAREGRADSGGSAAAVVGELALGLAGGVGLVLLVRIRGVVGFELLDDSIAFGHARELVVMSHLPWSQARIWFTVVAVLLLGSGLLLWSLTQRNLWADGPAGRARVPTAVGSRLVGLFVLRAVVGLFVPVCLVVAALLVQAVALLASLRSRETGGAAAAPFPLGYAVPVRHRADRARPGHAPGYVPPVPSTPPVAVPPPVAGAAVRAAGRVRADAGRSGRGGGRGRGAGAPAGAPGAEPRRTTDGRRLPVARTDRRRRHGDGVPRPTGGLRHAGRAEDAQSRTAGRRRTAAALRAGGAGTLTYMAPEQLDDGAVGPAADVWAWACCVVCAAHGASPFAATGTGAVIRRIVDTGPEPLALGAVQVLDPELAAVVGRALTADPAARPADGAALVRLLTAEQPDPTPFADTLRDRITRGWRTLAF